MRVGDFFTNNTFLLISTLSAQTSKPPFPFSFWTYIQLCHFLNDQFVRSDFSRQHTPFKLLFSNTGPQRHLISAYIPSSFLNTTQNPSIQWEKDLSINLSEEEWEDIYSYIHKGTINVTVQENGFKVFSRWYKTPSNYTKFTLWRPPNAGDVLPKRAHFFTYGGTVLSSKTSGKKYTATRPKSLPYYFYTIPLSQKKILPLLATLTLNKRHKMCIPVYWKSPNPPTIAEWIRQVNGIVEMEDMVHRAKDTSMKYRKTWACWQHFQMTTEYTQLMTL